MTDFHFILIGEDGTEFPHTVTAESRQAACDEVAETYPEAKIRSGPKTTKEIIELAREREARLERILDGDPYGEDVY